MIVYIHNSKEFKDVLLGLRREFSRIDEHKTNREESVFLQTENTNESDSVCMVASSAGSAYCEGLMSTRKYDALAEHSYQLRDRGRQPGHTARSSLP